MAWRTLKSKWTPRRTQPQSQLWPTQLIAFNQIGATNGIPWHCFVCWVVITYHVVLKAWLLFKQQRNKTSNCHRESHCPGFTLHHVDTNMQLLVWVRLERHLISCCAFLLCVIIASREFHTSYRFLSWLHAYCEVDMYQNETFMFQHLCY